jgi:hypothetical protein
MGIGQVLLEVHAYADDGLVAVLARRGESLRTHGWLARVKGGPCFVLGVVAGCLRCQLLTL